MAKEAKTKFLQEAFLNCVCRNVPMSGYPEVWLALFQTVSGEAGTGLEVTGPGYGRIKVTFEEPVLATSPATGSRCDLTADAQFPTATGQWTTANYVAVMTAETDGTMLYSKALSSAKTLESGERLTFYVGDFAITED